jgi:hypothetical protein
MGHFVGLDVSVKETSVCVVDAAGRVILEQKVPTDQPTCKHRQRWPRLIRSALWPSAASLIKCRLTMMLNQAFIFKCDHLRGSTTLEYHLNARVFRKPVEQRRRRDRN